MLDNLYAERRSLIHNLNFWVKFMGFSFVLPLTAFLATSKGLLILGAVFVITLLLSRIGLWLFWRMSKIYIISVFVSLILLSLVTSAGPLLGRLIEGTILSLRFVLLIVFGLLFAVITNPIEIPAAFLQTKIPHKYGVTLMVGYRLMPLLSQKIQTIINAQRARGARIDLSLKNIPRLPIVLFALAIPILHSTLETSVRLSDALISRGYSPNGKITPIPLRVGGYDLLFSGLVIFAFVLSLKI